VEVSPPAAAAATATDVHVARRGETVVRRAVAAAAATMPVEAVAEVVAAAVAVAARVVKVAQVVVVRLERRDTGTGLDAEPLVALAGERVARLGEGTVAAKVVVEDLDPLLTADASRRHRADVLLLAHEELEVLMPLVLVDAVVATEAVHATVNAGAVEVSPPAAAAATATDVHVARRGETVVRRAVAAAAATMPVEAVAEAVAAAVAVAARVVKAAQVVLVRCELLDAAAGLDLKVTVPSVVRRMTIVGAEAAVAAEVVVEDLRPNHA